MPSVFTKAAMGRLEPWERARLMELQMSPAYSSRSDYLPDDCSECGACGAPTLGSGWCARCHSDYARIVEKAAAPGEPAQEAAVPPAASEEKR